MVDDSATMRRLVSSALMSDPDIEVVSLAPDAATARQAIKDLSPDVMTLDIEMPNMNGLDFLEKVMRLRPMPVVMVSTLTAHGSEATIEAMSLGAIECVLKPTPDNPYTFSELPMKVKIAAQAVVSVRGHDERSKLVSKPNNSNYSAGDKIIAIGASTGGVEALLHVIGDFPAQCAPTVITQHMPAHFTATLARRLDRNCAPTVVEATDGEPLRVGHVYLAPGGNAHLEVAGRGPFTCRLRTSDAVNGHRPSVDVLFESVARCAGSRSIGAILTGMGRDGATGLLAMRQKGARTIGQDAASCVVYGMPKVAAEIGGVGLQLPINKIGPEITRLAGHNPY